jgi:predicted metal-dependent phosphotriesterase family hydrolase
MANNTKQTSSRIGKLASVTMQNQSASQAAKSLAASALAQRNTGKQTGAQMENLASKVLNSNRYAIETKELAASVLSQANKAR